MLEIIGRFTTFYWTKETQIRFKFVLCSQNIQYAKTFIRYIVTYYDTYIYLYLRILQHRLSYSTNEYSKILESLSTRNTYGQSQGRADEKRAGVIWRMTSVVEMVARCRVDSVHVLTNNMAVTGPSPTFWPLGTVD